MQQLLNGLIMASEVGAALGLSKRTLQRFVRSGRLGPVLRLGQRVWLDKNAVEAALTPKIPTSTSKGGLR